ncbi:hypothetical protein GCM10027066_20120 [Dyella jejuensis]
MPRRMTPAAALAAREQAGKTLAGMVGHGSPEVEIFQLAGTGMQAPHRRERCVVSSGKGHVVCSDARQTFGPGDVPFAPPCCGDSSRIFCAWTMSCGPSGSRTR